MGEIIDLEDAKRCDCGDCYMCGFWDGLDRGFEEGWDAKQGHIKSVIDTVLKKSEEQQKKFGAKHIIDRFKNASTNRK